MDGEGWGGCRRVGDEMGRWVGEMRRWGDGEMRWDKRKAFIAVTQISPPCVAS